MATRMSDPSFLAGAAAVIGFLSVPVLLPMAIAASRRGSAAGNWSVIALLAVLVICVTAFPILIYGIPFLLVPSALIGISVMMRRATDEMQRELHRNATQHEEQRGDGE